MLVRRLLSFSTVLVLGICPLFAQSVAPDTTITTNIYGTVGPVLSGSDPLGANGGTGVLKVVASESLSPISTTATSASYRLPPGAITLTLNGTAFTTTSASKMTFTVPSQGPDYVLLNAAFQELGLTVTFAGRAALKHGSFTSAVFTHPTPFSPSPQKLVSATTATGPGTRIQYTIQGLTTVLGFSGGASNTSALDAVLPDDSDQ